MAHRARPVFRAGCLHNASHMMPKPIYVNQSIIKEAYHSRHPYEMTNDVKVEETTLYTTPADATHWNHDPCL